MLQIIEFVCFKVTGNVPQSDGVVVEMQEVSEMAQQQEVEELRKEKENLELRLESKIRQLEGLRKAYYEE